MMYKPKTSLLQERPYVWEMIKESVQKLGGRATYGQIIEHINSTWNDVNKNTILAQIAVCTVNHPSRIHYPENNKPRPATGRYDFLYKIGRGEVVLYDPQKHGKWAIVEQNGVLVITQEEILELEEEREIESDKTQSFALESHLRDFLSKHLEIIEKGLILYRDENQREGVEYPTDTGPIDILAKDSTGNFVVFELKVGRGADRTVGQLQRYTGWVRKKISNGSNVRGIIIAQSIDEGLKYAASENPNIKIYEYKLQFKVEPANL